ncbi:hypothetical protein MMC07_004373 [Pseudocyphellaria aurata]|nr:hypothetical protein [Pseudocyphellaria aurata]
MKHPTHDFKLLRRCMPTYLFRVHSSSSQGSNSSSGFQAAAPAPPSIPPFSIYRTQLSEHLRWFPTPSPWISTTSSLLWALAFARFKAISGEIDVQISLLASAEINPTTLFLSGYLVRIYRLRALGRPWHDRPQGEFLAWGQIPASAMRGTVAWKSLAASADQLFPKLAPDEDDRPHQRVNAMRKIGFLPKEAGMDQGMPVTKQDYIAALAIASLFGDEVARLPLLVMGLSFRARNLESLRTFFSGSSRDILGMNTPTISPSQVAVGSEDIPELKECARLGEGLRLWLKEKPKL